MAWVKWEASAKDKKSKNRRRWYLLWVPAKNKLEIIYEFSNTRMKTVPAGAEWLGEDDGDILLEKRKKGSSPVYLDDEFVVRVPSREEAIAIAEEFADGLGRGEIAVIQEAQLSTVAIVSAYKRPAGARTVKSPWYPEDSRPEPKKRTSTRRTSTRRTSGRGYYGLPADAAEQIRRLRRRGIYET